ncbi:hypothetical protein Ahy_B04g073036 isoform C [Arachis hypogaea]|uniref:F-box domain-containing protein n=1 Tax=Arachis hypogaea TaxID=3818 RepID=A0A444ZPB7_ARAHY|nr:hypothetical protein Ahy_B04g073036 isoform C [Arachis hypogaea]
MDEKMDQISSLPETILHDILSRLPKKDAIKTSVLSKTWREIFYTFPILSICDRESIRRSSKRKKDQQIKTFLDYGKQRLLRFSEQGLAIKEFKLKLSLTCFDLQLIYPDVDQWLKLASECDLQTLKLCLPTLKEDDPCLCYILHPGVIEARSLNKLVLKGRIRFDKDFLNPSVKFSSLCVLSLCYVLFDDEGAIEHVNSHCPLIEHITLKWCYVYNPQGARDLQISLMKSVSMHGLQKLKGVDIQGVQNVYIDAPNIEKIYYGADSYEPSKMNFDSCGNLRALTLMNMKIEFLFTDIWFLHLSSKFPFLESLELVECSMYENINISSSQLKALVLSNCSIMEKLEIDTPNLLSFRYYYAGDNLPSISFLRCSSQLEVNVLFNMIHPRLYQLGKFVEQFKPQKFLASLSLSIRPCIPSDEHFYYYEYRYWEDPYSLPPTLPVPCIKHLVIRSVREDKSKYALLVNRLFYGWCPETISLSLNPSHCTKAFIEDVKVTSSVKNDVNVVDFVHLKSVLGGWTSSDNANISFRLK